MKTKYSYKSVKDINAQIKEVEDAVAEMDGMSCYQIYHRITSMVVSSAVVKKVGSEEAAQRVFGKQFLLEWVKWAKKMAPILILAFKDEILGKKSCKDSGYCKSVRELTVDLLSIIDDHQGDSIIFVSDDEEGNGYHGLFYGPEMVTEMSLEIRAAVEDINTDFSILKDPDKAVYMG